MCVKVSTPKGRNQVLDTPSCKTHATGKLTGVFGSMQLAGRDQLNCGEIGLIALRVARENGQLADRCMCAYEKVAKDIVFEPAPLFVNLIGLCSQKQRRFGQLKKLESHALNHVFKVLYFLKCTRQF